MWTVQGHELRPIAAKNYGSNRVNLILIEALSMLGDALCDRIVNDSRPRNAPQCYKDFQIEPYDLILE